MTPSRGEDGSAGLAALALALLGFSWGFIIIRLVGLPTPTIVFWRLLIGAGALTAAALAMRTSWPSRWRMVVGAGAAFGVHQIAIVQATKGTTIAVVTLIAALQPLVVALVSRRVVGEQVPAALRWCAVLALAGVWIVVQASLSTPGRTLAGDLWSVAGMLGYTACFLFSKRARDQGAPTLTLTAGTLWIALILVSPGLLLGGAIVPRERADLALLALIALGPGNGQLLVNWAHPRVSAALSSLVLAALPLLASVWARLVFGEPFTWRHAAGMLLVLAAIEVGRRVESLRLRVPAGL
ncbi:MAG: DMT family transporter [Egibacteraceae bacterium]